MAAEGGAFDVHEGPSMWWRVALAIVLTIGFYVLSLAAVAGLTGWAWMELRDGGQVLIPVCAIAFAVAILLGVLPRFDRDDARGPSLDRAAQPRLFGVIDAVANAAGQETPADVRLVWDANASVEHRGGWLGFGGRRAIELGFPLLQTLSVAHLRGVLAHEFGHFHGGDARLAPWIHRAQMAVIRTMDRVRVHILGLPIYLYGYCFLRVTHAISRQQELAADRLASAIAGREAARGGLERIDRIALSATAFWTTEVVPLLEGGYRPPLREGFERFLEAPEAQKDIVEAAAEVSAETEAEAFDSHPPTAVRIAAIDALPDRRPLVPVGAGDDATAIGLLDDPDQYDLAMLAAIGGDEDARALKLIGWDDLHGHWMTHYVEQAQSVAPLISGWQAGELPDRAPGMRDVGRTIGLAGGEKLEDDLARQVARFHVGSALIVGAVARGFALELPVGRPVGLVRDDAELKPFAALQDLADGTIDAAGWAALMASTGLGDLDLGAVAPDADSPDA